MIRSSEINQLRYNLFSGLGIHNCDGDHIYNFSHGAAELKNMHRLFHAKQNRTNYLCAAQLLNELICYISRFKIRKDKGIRRTIRQLAERKVIA